MKATAVQIDLFTGLARPGEAYVLYPDRRAADDPRPSSVPASRVHDHSRAAHAKRRDQFAGRKGLILDCLRLANRPLTIREIRDRLFPGGDMNLIRPRVSELIAERRLFEVCQVKDATTDEDVAQVWLA